VTTPRHQQSTLSKRDRPAVGVAVCALVMAVALAVVTTGRSDATDATNAASSRIDDTLTAIQAAQRGTDRADRGTERSALPPTSASAGAATKPATPTRAAAPAPARPSTRPAAPVKVAARKPTPVPAVIGYRYATTALNLRATASASALIRQVVPRGTRIAITGTLNKTWAQAVVDGQSAWVTETYLATSRPTAVKASPPSAAVVTIPTGFSTAACATGSSMESGSPRTPSTSTVPPVQPSRRFAASAGSGRPANTLPVAPSTSW